MPDETGKVRTSLEEPELRGVEAKACWEFGGHCNQWLVGLCAYAQGHELTVLGRRVTLPISPNRQQRKVPRQLTLERTHHGFRGVVALKRRDDRTQQLREM